MRSLLSSTPEVKIVEVEEEDEEYDENGNECCEKNGKLIDNP